MIVNIPGPLRSYTKNKSQVEGRGESLSALLNDLDSHYPGIKFRMIDEQDNIRQHIRLFVDAKQAKDISVSVNPSSTVHIICALSGG